MAKKRSTPQSTFLENPYHSRPATLLDHPEVEDCFTQDLINPKVNAERQGWRPSWSRYRSFGVPELHETMPAKKQHDKTFYEGYEASDSDNDVDQDYRDPTAFRSIYK